MPLMTVTPQSVKVSSLMTNILMFTDSILLLSTDAEEAQTMARESLFANSAPDRQPMVRHSSSFSLHTFCPSCPPKLSHRWSSSSRQTVESLYQHLQRHSENLNEWMNQSTLSHFRLRVLNKKNYEQSI